jgi:ribosomal protein S12 methylthiotransferase
MQRQQEISRRRLKRRIGARERIIVDEVNQARGGNRSTAKGRSKGDAPQIDVRSAWCATGRCASAKSRQ